MKSLGGDTPKSEIRFKSQRRSKVVPTEAIDLKDKIYMRLWLKMSKKFGSSKNTATSISNVLDQFLKEGQKLQASDFDRMENDIFNSL